MARNPIATCQTLVEEIDEALETLTMAQARRDDLTSLGADAAELRDRLQRFHDEYVPLDLQESDRIIEDAYALWAAVPAGVYRQGTAELERIVTASACLQSLYSAGVTISSIKKFSAEETAFAAELGDSFDAVKDVWGGLKVRLDQSRVTLRFRRGQLTEVRRFLAQVEAIGVGTAGDVEHMHFEKGKEPAWKESTKRALSRVHENTPMRVTITTATSTNRALFTGEWLNAYAAQIVHDHLVRNSIPHEIYTNVEYRSPADIIHVSGDFDVIVQAVGQVAAFECKSGRLDPQRNAFEPIIEKAKGLRRVFDLTGTDLEITNFLLFNPEATDRALVAETLEPTGIVCLTPEEVRGAVINLFRPR